MFVYFVSVSYKNSLGLNSPEISSFWITKSTTKSTVYDEIYPAESTLTNEQDKHIPMIRRI